MSVYTVIDNIEKGYKRNTLGSTDYLPSRDKIFFDFNYKKPQPILCINKKHTREERLSSYLDIEVNGKSFKIPIELKHVAENIEDAKEILDYADDWDDESAIVPGDPVDETLARWMRNFLH